MSQDSVKSLMNSRVISVLPETPVITAIDIILSNNFNGIPVVDKKGILVGIVTKYDIISKRGLLQNDSKVSDVMNGDPLTLSENMTVDDAISSFGEHHKVDPIPVVDTDRKVIGIISRYDMVKLFREYGLDFSSSNKNNKPSSISRSNTFFWWLLGGLVISAGVVYYFFF
ncbi:MAG: CBS domain-containing protein [Candidatus Taylorbacteria bacterium]|nr:CBS domain-containing protein [Candidatus Taylorbacteria bacterium]